MNCKLESGSPKILTEKLINSKPKRLSIDELRSFAGFENCTDEIAEETITSLETLSILFYEHYQKSIQQKERLDFLRRNEDRDQ